MEENINRTHTLADESESVKKRRVMKNTLMLYGRMLFLMVISFIATRIVLHSLGEVDYGLNNAVAGFVALFGLLTGSLNAAISRFITFELGKGDRQKLIRVFSTAVFIQLGMATIVALLLETIGIWFLNTYMTIPLERLTASRWVFHFSVINTFIALTFVPYSAAIISHEKMNIYAYIGVFEGLFNLLCAYLVSLNFWSDKLIFYSAFLCVCGLVTNLFYRIYCTHQFEECHLRKVFDKNLLKSITSFAGWNLFGASASVLRSQGVNLLFNIFFGPVVNAARGISVQTTNISTKFSQGFMQAFNPQITKSYAAGDLKYMYSLVYQGTRLSFFLFLVIALPIFMETDTLLRLWLVEYPNHSVSFVRITLFYLLVDIIIAGPPTTIMLATGNIKNYQLLVGGTGIMVVPLSYVVLKFGCSPEFVMFIILAVAVITGAERFYMLHRMVDYPVVDYAKNVLFPIAYITVLSAIIPAVLYFLLSRSLWIDLLICAISVFSACLTIWLVGLHKSEKKLVLKKVSGAMPFKSTFIMKK